MALFLNGLPIITIELKHEKNQNVHDAVTQYAKRDHTDCIFKLPFLHIAADTSDVMVEDLSQDLETLFSDSRSLGRKYLIHHSAGSGKTLSICWLADRLHSLYRAGTNEKIIQIIFILTDRKSLDKNIKEDMEKLAHLKGVVRFAKKARDLNSFIQKRSAQIIVTTQQKFHYILEQIQANESLKKLRVAFLIDEAHRSQEGKTAMAVKQPFRDPDIEDAEPDDPDKTDPQEEMAKIIRSHDGNQVFVAFTATPSRATLALLGESFDTYTEDEAIQEGYILDVATWIISYKTLYHLHCPMVPKPEEEKIYPAGIVAKALKNVRSRTMG